MSYYTTYFDEIMRLIENKFNKFPHLVHQKESHFKRIPLDKGLDLCFMHNLNYEDQLSLDQVSRFQAVEINFCFQGKLEVHFPSIKKDIVYKQGELCFNAINDITTTFREKLVNYSGFTIIVTRAYLERLVLGETTNHSSVYHDIITKLFDDDVCSIFQPEPHTLSIALEIVNAENKDETLAKEMHLRRLIYEFIFFALQAKAKERTHIDCVENAKAIIIENFCNPPTLTHLAELCQSSPSALKVGFRKTYNTTVFGYIRQQRMNHAKALLEQGLNVTQVAFEVGYMNPSQFSKAFRTFFGRNPKTYKI